VCGRYIKPEWQLNVEGPDSLLSFIGAIETKISSLLI